MPRQWGSCNSRKGLFKVKSVLELMFQSLWALLMFIKASFLFLASASSVRMTDSQGFRLLIKIMNKGLAWFLGVLEPVSLVSCQWGVAGRQTDQSWLCAQRSWILGPGKVGSGVVFAWSWTVTHLFLLFPLDGPLHSSHSPFPKETTEPPPGGTKIRMLIKTC